MNPITSAERAEWNARHQENAPDHIKFGTLVARIKETQADLLKLYAFPGRWHELAEKMSIIHNAAKEAAECAEREASRLQTSDGE
ncbi:hypothetical protein D3C87_1347890 [compost metagenome]